MVTRNKNGKSSTGLRIQGEPPENSVFQQFCRDTDAIQSLRVTEQELEALSRVSLLGSLSCKEDIIFILEQLRGRIKTTAGEVSSVEAHNKTESLRHAALTNLNEQEERIARRGAFVVHRLRLILGGRD